MDLIDRQKAIDALKRKQDDGKGDLSRFYNTIIQHDIEAIMALPPAQPKRGKWIVYTVSPFDGADVKCSECGQRGCATCWDFCPNCGAKMEETT